jgi:predicted MFS family arabinose efflux permease
MLVQSARNPGATIGINGLAGNLGVAGAAILTGILVESFGWRAAFIVPGLISLACGVVFARTTPRETEAPAKRTQKAAVTLTPAMLVRVFLVMTTAAITGSLLFNFTTNGNGQLLSERLQGLVENPSVLGSLLALVYTIASFAQVIVGHLIDRMSLKRLYLGIAVAQVPVLLLAAHTTGWAFYALLTLAMVLIFGAIPFTDAMIVRYVDDRMRSRVAGMRLAVSFGVSSIAVWLLGPVVKSGGFATLLIAMACIAVCTSAAISLLPSEERYTSAAQST